MGSKGAEGGYFDFPGTTVLVLFEKNAIKLDQDLLQRSSGLMETRLQSGSSLGECSSSAREPSECSSSESEPSEWHRYMVPTEWHS